MELNISPEEVNKFMAESILKSSLGTVLNDAIKKSIEDLSKSYNNPFDSIIRNHVHLIIEQTLRDNYREFITARIKEKLTEDMVDTVLQSAWQKLVSKY